MRTVLAQFEGVDIPVRVFPKILRSERAFDILALAKAENAVVAYTFVDPQIRQAVRERAARMEVEAIDLFSPLIDTLSAKLGQEPLGKPGLYRQLYRSYFDRISAMDFTLDHDDGKNPEGWSEAEVLLMGASRVGKTPISVYLSVMGWKVANVPLFAEIAPPKRLFELDEVPLIGLTIAPSELIEHRRHRQDTLGIGGKSTDYTNPTKVYEEVQAIESLLHRRGIPIVDVTGKPIETCADEIIRVVKRRYRRGKRITKGAWR